LRITTYLTSACLTLLGTMAAAQYVTYDYDHAANFSAYKTYAWSRGAELSDELNHPRLVQAIDAGLAAKGLTRVERDASSDVLVAYHASFELNQVITGRYLWGSARVESILEATLVVDISDARTNAIVWRSQAISDVRPSDTPENRDKKIAKAMEKMFKNYPPKSR
jgi:Domain of unknown function (DUF4136)